MSDVTITVTEIVDGVSVESAPTTITVDTGVGATGPQGPAGPAGSTGATGATGAAGADGQDGADGQGVPTGGTSGQVLAKASATDFDTEWTDAASGGGAVDSVNGQTGTVVLDASDVGADPSGSASTAQTAAEGYTDSAIASEVVRADAAYATAAQGTTADSAVQPGDLAAVATSGAYSDLTGTPTIPSTAVDVGAVPTTRTVAGHALSADVTLAKGDVGLGNVDNTADSAKTFTESQVTGLTTDLAAKAPLASPAFTGHPTGVTESPGDNSTRLATTAYTDAAVAAGGGGGGGTALDPFLLMGA